jgi:hypothetical protein
MFRPPLLPRQGSAGGLKTAVEKVSQGGNHHDKGPAPRGKKRRGTADKVFQYRFPRLGRDIGKDKVPAAAGIA